MATIREMMLNATRLDNELWKGILIGEDNELVAARLVDAMRAKQAMQAEAERICAEMLTPSVVKESLTTEAEAPNA